MTVSKKYLFIDFEYNKPVNQFLNLVSCCYWSTTDMKSFTPEKFWLHNNESEKDRLFTQLEKFGDSGYTIVCYSGEAEGRSMLSLCSDLYLPDWKWIDLFLEYRHLLNNNNDLAYGKQLIDGKVKITYPPKPKWEQTEEDKAGQKPQEGLAAACFKLLGVKVDTERKNRVRDLIISAPDKFSFNEEMEILEYNMSDIEYLPRLLTEMWRQYTKLLDRKERKTLLDEMLYRGEYSVRNAHMVNDGYPINVERTRQFSDSVPMILKELARDINSQFDDFKPYIWKKKEQRYGFQVKLCKEYIRKQWPHLVDNWILSDSGDLSLSLDAFSKHFPYTHSYPRDNLGAQIVRFLKTKQSLNGFMPKAADAKNKKTFWDSVGDDGRVRAYMNIFKSQSARTQPSSTSFIFLKAAWMRVLVEPPKGKMLIGIDWSSQEFLIGALMSGDKNMLRAYQSGDPYFWFAKAAKAVPEDAKREDYSSLRDAFKATTLAEMYMMGVKALAAKLTNDTGRVYTEEEAEDLDALFKDVFWEFCDWREAQVQEYYADGKLKMLDGYYLWNDNLNFRSIANCPIQGAGSAIMRKSVAFAQDLGLDIVFTLHDADYALVDLGDFDKVDVLADCMDKAFRHYFPDNVKPLATCRMEADVWSPELEDKKLISSKGVPITQKSLYIDKRSIDDYKRFEKYFQINNLEDLF